MLVGLGDMLGRKSRHRVLGTRKRHRSTGSDLGGPDNVHGDRRSPSPLLHYRRSTSKRLLLPLMANCMGFVLWGRGDIITEKMGRGKNNWRAATPRGRLVVGHLLLGSVAFFFRNYTEVQ